MSKANFYTALRIVMAPVFFILYFFSKWTGFELDVLVWMLFPYFVFMEFTDFLDGYYARKEKTVSDFGKLFDPFADVLANLTVLLIFVLDGYMPVVFFLIILYREMGIMFIRMLASRKGIAIGARKGGKTKTVLYIVAAGFSLLLESGVRLGYSPVDHFAWLAYVNYALYTFAVIASVASFIDYLTHFSNVWKKTENDV